MAVTAMKGPPQGIPARAKESRKDIPPIQKTSVTGMPRLEYERKIKTKLIV